MSRQTLFVQFKRSVLHPQYLSMEEFCKICKEKMSIEHSMPCTHSFCYLCIRRHLSQRNFCPVCYEGPYTICNLSTLHKPNNAVPKLNQFYRKSERSLRRELRRYGLSDVRDKDVLDWRFNELCILLGNERLRETPEPMYSIAEKVSLNEGLMAVNEGKEANEIKAIESLCKLKEFIKKIKKNEK